MVTKHKNIYFFIVLLISNACLAETYDTVAYATGNLIGEITIQAWVAATKHNEQLTHELANRLAITSEPYLEEYNEDFFHGILDCLEENDLKEQAEEAQLDTFGYALVLACKYCWLAQLMYYFEIKDIYSESFLNEIAAISKAITKVYGQPLPDKIAHVQAILNDPLGLFNLI